MQSGNFLILLGVSGCGKSSLIKELLQIDRRFVYIKPYTNRGLREGETDKVYKTDAEMEELSAKGKILMINEIYGFKYATPKEPIDNALMNDLFPVLDFPIHRFDSLKEKYPDDIYSIYVKPPGLSELRRRLKDGRDTEGKRFESAVRELKEIEYGLLNCYDAMVVNHNDKINETARFIYKRFYTSRKDKYKE